VTWAEFWSAVLSLAFTCVVALANRYVIGPALDDMSERRLRRKEAKEEPHAG